MVIFENQGMKRNEVGSLGLPGFPKLPLLAYRRKSISRKLDNIANKE